MLLLSEKLDRGRLEVVILEPVMCEPTEWPDRLG